MALLKEVYEHQLIEGQARPLGPVIAVEDHVAVHPDDSVAVTGDRLQGDVEQTFLLPHDIAAGELHEDVRITRLELKAAVEREFHGHQWHREALPEVMVVLDPPSVADGVEVAGDRPETSGASPVEHRVVALMGSTFGRVHLATSARCFSIG